MNILKSKYFKMWAEYNYSPFPIVEVHMKGTIKNDEEFEDFLNQWRQLYQRKTGFSFIFDTREVGYVKMKYALKMANFIKELKKENKQYLKRSAIITGNWWTRLLLKMIFTLQTPVAPVEYHSSIDTIDLDRLLYNANVDWVSIV